MQKQPTEYFANNSKVYVSTIGSFAVRDMESQQLYTVVPDTKSEKKKEAFKFELESLLKCMNYNVKAFTDYLVSGEYTSNRKNMRVSIYNRY